MRFLPTLLLISLLSACQSSWKEKYDAIELGMAKSQVLEVAGPPHWSDHKGGYDRWIYYMKPETRQQKKVVYFQGGQVVRKGLHDKPVLTADEIEEIKKPRIKTKAYRRKYNDKQLKKIIKKEIQKEKIQKKSNFEEL